MTNPNSKKFLILFINYSKRRYLTNSSECVLLIKKKYFCSQPSLSRVTVKDLFHAIFYSFHLRVS